MKECLCKDYQKNIKIIDAFIDFGRIHGINYTAKFFEYCPWCGKKLIEKIDNNTK